MQDNKSNFKSFRSLCCSTETHKKRYYAVLSFSQLTAIGVVEHGRSQYYSPTDLRGTLLDETFVITSAVGVHTCKIPEAGQTITLNNTAHGWRL